MENPLRSPRQRLGIKPIMSTTHLRESPQAVNKNNKQLSASKGTPLQKNFTGRGKHFSTEQKENNACMQNIIVSKEIKSQLKFEVAVSLSSELSTCTNAQVNQVKVVDPHMAKADLRVAKEPKGKTPVKKLDKGITSGSKCTPKLLKCAEIDKVVRTPNSEVLSIQLPRARTDDSMVGKRKIAEADKVVGSPKVKKPDTKHNRPCGPGTPNSSSETLGAENKHIRTPTRFSQEKEKGVAKAKSDSGGIKVVDQTTNSIKTPGTPKSKDSGCQTKLPAVKRRQIYQSPRPEGCVSPKRKPGTPWRECQLRKLAEEQKAMDEAQKQAKRKTQTCLSPLTRPPLKHCEKKTQPSGLVESGILQKSSDQACIDVGSDVDRDTPMSPKQGTSTQTAMAQPVSSVDSSAQTIPEKTVLSRFKSKLAQSYEKTVEYFQEVKNIWDGK